MPQEGRAAGRKECVCVYVCVRIHDRVRQHE